MQHTGSELKQDGANVLMQHTDSELTQDGANVVCCKPGDWMPPRTCHRREGNGAKDGAKINGYDCGLDRDGGGNGAKNGAEINGYYRGLDRDGGGGLAIGARETGPRMVPRSMDMTVA